MSMSNDRVIKISRDGKLIGTYKIQDVIMLLSAGTLRLTDLYWFEGMSDWALLSKLQEIEDRASKIEQKAKADADEIAKKKIEAAAIAKAKREAEYAKAETEYFKKERGGLYKCSRCDKEFSESFRKTKSQVIFIGGVFVFIALGASRTIENVNPALLFLSIGILISSFIPARCPNCGSGNFAKVEKPKD
jgi:rubrerythrin